MNGADSIRLAANFDAAIPRHTQKYYPQTPPEASKKANVDQIVETNDVTTVRTKLAKMVRDLAVRRQLQHAADGQFPYTGPGQRGHETQIRSAL